jgi:hypothetical protein
MMTIFSQTSRCDSVPTTDDRASRAGRKRAFSVNSLPLATGRLENYRPLWTYSLGRKIGIRALHILHVDKGPGRQSHGAPARIGEAFASGSHEPF